MPTASPTSPRQGQHPERPGRGRTGRFQPKWDFATDIGPTALVAGDLDGDGLPDLALTNRTALTVSVFLNRLP